MFENLCVLSLNLIRSHDKKQAHKSYAIFVPYTISRLCRSRMRLVSHFISIILVRSELNMKSYRSKPSHMCRNDRCWQATSVRISMDCLHKNIELSQTYSARIRSTHQGLPCEV